jgi:hypothetical protein
MRQFMHSRLGNWLLAASVVALPVLVAAQSELQKRTLVVNGQSGEITIYRIGGQSYVDLESLARIANGSVTLKGDQIILTLSTGSAAQVSPNDEPAKNLAMSNDFMKEAIQALAPIRSWYATLAQAIQRGVPGDGSRLVVYRDQAAENVRLAAVAASTRSDQDALQLLNNHFNHVDRWYQKLVGERKAMSTGKYSLTQDALENDPEYQKITSCSKFLGAMLASGQYEKDASCE